jgi:hypothetical protein
MPSARPSPRRIGVALSVLLPALLAGALAGARPAAAAYFGAPVPDTGYHQFQHGLEADRTVRKLTSSRWTSPVTLRNLRLVARESYGVLRWQDVRMDASVLFGVSKAEIDFGTVDMQDGGVFWEKYAPGTTVPGTSRRSLQFGDTYGSSWGGGLRARLFRLGQHEVGGGVQVLYSQSTDTRLPAMRLRYNEWDFFLGSRWEERFVSFYAGLDASYMVGELQLPDRATDLDQDALLGLFGGLKMKFYRHLLISTDLRLINQASFSAQLVYTF